MKHHSAMTYSGQIGWDGSPGGLRYRAPYGANKI